MVFTLLHLISTTLITLKHHTLENALKHMDFTFLIVITLKPLCFLTELNK